jgi:hypothetical protein
MASLGLTLAFVVIGVFFLVSLFFLVLSPTLGGSSQESGAGLFLLSILALPLILGGSMIYGGWLAYHEQPSQGLWVLLKGMGAGAVLLAFGGWRFFR